MAEPPVPLPEGNSARMTLQEGLPHFFRQNGLGFGSVDIFCLGTPKPAERVHAVIGALLGFRNTDGHSPIRRFTVVVPNIAANRSGSLRALRARLERLLAASGT